MPHYVSLMRWTSQGRMGLPAWRGRVEEGIHLGHLAVVNEAVLVRVLDLQDQLLSLVCLVSPAHGGSLLRA